MAGSYGLRMYCQTKASAPDPKRMKEMKKVIVYIALGITATVTLFACHKYTSVGERQWTAGGYGRDNRWRVLGGGG